jgi:hypothetical protein
MTENQLRWWGAVVAREIKLHRCMEKTPKQKARFRAEVDRIFTEIYETSNYYPDFPPYFPQTLRENFQ